jgi:HTH-type transcriptional regulator / antitoxin HigA
MATKELIPFEATHPGSLIKDELEYRGMKQKDFAHDIDMSSTMLNEIIKGKRAITAPIALLLEKALGINASYWLRYQAKYELDTERIKDRNQRKLQLIEQWSVIKELVPIKGFRKLKIFLNDLEKDIQKVKQIYNTENLDGIADSLGTFKASSAAYYRKSEKLKVSEVNLLGWSKLAVWQCKNLPAANYDKSKITELYPAIRDVFYQNQDTRNALQELLKKYGIKLLFQEKFEKTPIDGYSFWSENNPAIALTLRHKRIDNLAFSLMHELAHIELHLNENKNSEFLDLTISNTKRSEKENEADKAAQENLISTEEWKDFMNNYTPYDDEQINCFSEKYKIHPYIVFGRINHEMNFYGRKTQINKNIN